MYYFLPDIYEQLRTELQGAGYDMNNYFEQDPNTGYYVCTDYDTYVSIINDLLGDDAADSLFFSWGYSGQINSTQGGGNL